MTYTASQRKITFLIDSKLENVSLVGVAVRGICSYLSLSEIDTYYLELSVVEAVNNAVRHAYNSEAGHAVEIDVFYTEDDITFQISDRGTRMVSYSPSRLIFDAGDLPMLPETGMGLYIIDSIMDEVTYCSEGDKNILTMRKYFHYKN